MINQEEMSMIDGMDIAIVWAIQDTWEWIAADAFDLCEGDNRVAHELTVDLDRMMLAGFPEEQEQLYKMFDEYGYDAMLDWLSKNVQLL
jgi:hypothetical protein